MVRATRHAGSGAWSGFVDLVLETLDTHGSILDLITTYSQIASPERPFSVTEGVQGWAWYML